jgi:glycine cleavage system regulatory protein
MNRMGDKFSVMMMTSLKHEATVDPSLVISRLKRQLKASLNRGDDDDLQVNVVAADKLTQPHVMEMATINVMGCDAEGIMKAVTTAVASCGIDILNAESKGPVSAPFSGETMFELEMVVTVPVGTAMVNGADALCNRLSTVEERFQNIDIQFDLMDSTEVWEFEHSRDHLAALDEELILHN